MAIFSAGEAHAGAVTDGSVGAVQTLSGAMTVPQTLGTVRGGNLFHSFARFGIAVGESATFTTVDPGIRHVISRVTGGEASVLQGPLALLAGGGARPDFWLLNPAGVLVGAGASFDLPAGLHLSTAPQLRFADGEVWATGSAAPSTLTIAAPESFGFITGQTAAALRWQDSNAVLAPGATLSLAGGEVAVDQALLLVPGGEIRLQAQGAVRLGPGALVGATAPSNLDAGRITVDAGSLRLDGEDLTGGTGGLGALLLVQTGAAGSGSGITLRLAGALELGPGAEISATSAGQGGGITVTAARLFADGGSIGSQNAGAGPGAASTFDLQGALELVGGGAIRSFALADGPAGDLLVRAGSVRLDGTGPLGPSGLGSFGLPGALSVVTPGLLEVRQGAGLSSANQSPGIPGAMTVQAGSLVVDGAGAPTVIGSISSGSGPAASVLVEVSGETRLVEGGQITITTLGPGAGGVLRVRSDTLSLQGSRAVTAISALSAGAGRGGAIEVDARLLDVIGGAVIANQTVSDVGGGAGDLTVRADRITLDSRGGAGGINSYAFGALGDAGQVRVLAREQMVIRDGGAIVAGALGNGSPGAIDVQAGTLLLDGRGAPATYTGIGGDAVEGGSAASVNVSAQRIEIREGSAISSATFSARDAGVVQVRADTLLIDGGGNPRTATGVYADSGDSGSAGSILINAREITVTGEGSISTSTLFDGGGGNIGITAERMLIERSGGVFSVTAGSGNAGRIAIDVGDTLTLALGGSIAANTGGAGAAGSIDIRAGRLVVGGSDPANGQRSRIASRAIAGSGGQTGSVTLDVTSTLELQADALLSIANDATVADPAALTPTTLALRAGSLSLDGADITAAASGNARAGAITIDTPGQLLATGSRISTSAVDGDGGPITMAAGGPILLKDSSITTSVTGTTNGNGGDITITTPALALASGFVQANTAAPLAAGGNVVINAGLLVPDGSNVFVGGSRIAAVRLGTPGYNVIQAAAPDGVAGRLDLTKPDLNLSSSLVALLVPVIDFGLIGRDICAAGTDSSFTVLGGGALPAAAAAPLRISPRGR
ncbi:MAG: filamentous hemagglutinin N-terminal domain-containing protein [Burkholderiales bacterium]|nr:filamentous hemagglutinin N-terminal domain-containing protein [Burkholderiales bacterium]